MTAGLAWGTRSWLLGFWLVAPGEEGQAGHDQSAGVVEVATDRAVQRIELALIGQARAAALALLSVTMGLYGPAKLAA